MARDTIGKISSKLLEKKPETTNPIEQMREQLTDYEKNIEECIVAHKKLWLTNFYIVVITKQEPLMPNVMRNYFLARLSCPTPDYDQILYKYDTIHDALHFIWVIPSRQTCFYLKQHALEVSFEERSLLKYVLAFDDKTLYKLCKKLNNEDSNSTQTI